MLFALIFLVQLLDQMVKTQAHTQRRPQGNKKRGLVVSLIELEPAIDKNQYGHGKLQTDGNMSKNYP